MGLTDTPTFYEVLDDVFDALFKKEGEFSDELINYKSKLLDIYDNENTYRSKEIVKMLTPMHWYIDNQGCFKLVEKKD